MLAMLITSGVVSLASADNTADVDKMATDDCARARKLNKTCVLKIEDEQIEGSTPTAGESPIVVNPFGTHGSLIRIRHHFIPEILKSAEDL